MPIEFTLLKDRPIPIGICPNCALICESCKEVVGYEKP